MSESKFCEASIENNIESLATFAEIDSSTRPLNIVSRIKLDLPMMNKEIADSKKRLRPTNEYQ